MRAWRTWPSLFISPWWSSCRSSCSALSSLQATYRRIIINFIWAFFFNIIGIPLAAGLFHPLGVLLPPWAAGLAMARQFPSSRVVN